MERDYKKLFFALLTLFLTIIYILYRLFIINYPKFIKTLPGPYKFIGVVYGHIPNSLSYKIFYPTAKIYTSSNQFNYPPYFKHGTITADGIYNFSKTPTPRFYFRGLNQDSHAPYFQNAPILIKKKDSFLQKLKKERNNIDNNINENDIIKYPLFVFSHGLGGNYDIYSNYLASIASYGFVVFVVDHDDGSASNTFSNGKHLTYAKPFLVDENGNKYTPNKWHRKDIIKFRGPQIQKRIQNILTGINYLLEKKDKIELFKYINFNETILAGHSYGGATVIGATKQLINNNQLNIKGVITYEPWYEPYTDTEISEFNYKIPNLTIIGDEWMNNKYLLQLCKNVNDTNTEKKLNYLEYFKGLTHMDFCDVIFWAPTYISRKFGIQSKIFEKEYINEWIVKRTCFFIGQICNEWKINHKVKPYLAYVKKDIQTIS